MNSYKAQVWELQQILRQAVKVQDPAAMAMIKYLRLKLEVVKTNLVLGATPATFPALQGEAVAYSELLHDLTTDKPGIPQPKEDD